MSDEIAVGQERIDTLGRVTVVEACRDKNGKLTGRFWCARSWSYVMLIYTRSELRRLPLSS